MQGKLVDTRRNNDGLVRETAVAICDCRDADENSHAAARLVEVRRGPSRRSMGQHSLPSSSSTKGRSPVSL